MALLILPLNREPVGLKYYSRPDPISRSRSIISSTPSGGVRAIRQRLGLASQSYASVLLPVGTQVQADAVNRGLPLTARGLGLCLGRTAMPQSA